MLQLSLDFLGHQLDRFRTPPQPRTRIDHALAWKHGLTVHLVFRPRARRYLLGLRPDGAARLVIPRRGTQAEGIRFLERSEAWLLKRIAQWKSRAHTLRPWTDGTDLLFRGEETRLRVEKARMLLAETNLRISEVASESGFGEGKHLHAIFTREVGVTPSLFRRKFQKPQ